MGFKAYEEIVNLQLLWQMKNLIRRVSTKAVLTDIRGTVFGERKTEQSMEEMYQLRYPGEVLERYRDKCGGSIINMRALAIALAEMREVLEDRMFVGSQKVVFLNQIRLRASEDIFLKGALFLLTDRNTERIQLEEELKNYAPRTTQEFVYLQSVLQAGSYGYDLNIDQCIHFFGHGRSIKAYGNQWIYVWMLRNYQQKIVSYRKNDGKYLKAFVQMLSGQVKEETQTWKSIIDVGYSRQELIYLHMKLPLYSVLGGRLKKDSITMERIVSWGCSAILNAEHVESPVLYEEIRDFLEMYSRFAIHIEGYSGLPEILQYRVKLQDIGLFLFLHKEFYNDGRFVNWFRVNLLEDRWDELAVRLTSEDYLDLFEYCFLELAVDGQKKDWITKYERLRGETYFRQFWTEYRSTASLIFGELVQARVFNMVSHLEQYADDKKCMDTKLLDEKWHHMFKYMAGLASRMETHVIFEFWEKYEQLFGMAELRKFLGNRDVISDAVNFRKTTYYEYQHVFTGLDFLTKEEKIKLFYWECDELFVHNAEYYNRFLVYFLSEPAVDLFTREQCRELFEVVAASLDTDSSNAERLRRIYFTEEELKQYVQMKKERREKAERERRQEEYIRWKNELLEGTDGCRKSTKLSAIVKKAHVYRIGEGYHELVYECIMNKFEAGYRQIEQDQIADLLKLMGKLVEEEVCKWEDFCKFIKQLEVVKSGT